MANIDQRLKVQQAEIISFADEIRYKNMISDALIWPDAFMSQLENMYGQGEALFGNTNNFKELLAGSCVFLSDNYIAEGSFTASYLLSQNISTITSISLHYCYGITPLFSHDFKLTSLSAIKFLSIPSQQFFNCPLLSTIYLERTQEIGDEAFYGAKNVTSFGLPEILTIGKSCFTSTVFPYNYYLSLPELTQIGEYAFQDVGGLTNFSASHLTSIGKGAFQNCPDLRAFIASQASIIPEDCFLSDSQLRSVLMANVQVVESRGLKGCNLRTLSLTNCAILRTEALAYNDVLTDTNLANVSFMEDRVFDCCWNLRELFFGKMLQMGNFVFMDCSNLTDIYLYSSKCSITSQTFSGMSNLPTIHVQSPFYDNYVTGLWASMSDQVVIG